MDISNRIPKAAEVNQTSQTEQTSESQTTSPEAAESSGGITEVTDQIRPGNALSPYAQLFESPTLNPQAIPVEALPAEPSATIIPDTLASVDPQTNLPENLQHQQLFNLPGVDLKISPDHFGIDLSGGGSKGDTSLDQILGFGSSGGLQLKGVDLLKGLRNWSLVSGVTATSEKSWGDEQNGGTEFKGISSDGTDITVLRQWSTDEDGNKTNSRSVQYDYPDGKSMTKSVTDDDSGHHWDMTNYDEKGNVTQIEQSQGDGSVLIEDYSNGEMTEYHIVWHDSDGSTTDEMYAPDHTYQGKVETDADGTQHVYDKDNKPVEPSGDEYVDPEGGPAVQTTVDPNNFLRIQNLRHGVDSKVDLRQNVNTTPSNVDDEQPIVIDPKRVYDPLKDPLVTDGNPEFSDSVIFTGESLTIRQGADGGDPVKPNDPDVAPLSPPTKPPDQ